MSQEQADAARTANASSHRQSRQKRSGRYTTAPATAGYTALTMTVVASLLGNRQASQQPAPAWQSPQQPLPPATTAGGVIVPYLLQPQPLPLQVCSAASIPPGPTVAAQDRCLAPITASGTAPGQPESQQPVQACEPACQNLLARDMPQPLPVQPFPPVFADPNRTGAAEAQVVTQDSPVSA